MSIMTRLRSAYKEMPHRRRQFIHLGVVLVLGFSLLWMIFAIGDSKPRTDRQRKPAKLTPTNLGIKVQGEIDPREAWLGTAGRDVAILKADVEAQQRKERERAATEAALLKRLRQLEEGASESNASADRHKHEPTNAGTPMSSGEYHNPTQVTTFPPATPVTAHVPAIRTATEAGPASAALDAAIVQVSLSDTAAKGAPVKPGAADSPAPSATGEKDLRIDSFLPVGFTPGLLLGGIDAPTGGQAQSNPLPILVRLTDNAVLPNRFRSQIKECFVVASGYGDISSERVYARTVSLSCVRHDGSALEIPIQGNLFGEDGKLGIRGRLVTKQGQILANALRAGIVGGIGQGFAQGGTTYTTSPFGTLATGPNGTAEQFRRGMAGGVGRALDNLANYYIRLAEQTFPVIEVDAGRSIEVAITKGAGMPAVDDIDTADMEEQDHEEN
ncbi:TrbI/VirB10 family protein [Massilia sp. YMA4]|uniref:TrbI/VirB10 family protein n=1 Tax=[Empedobacter] haloabium TaxID=592317 RepID=A0ABZ1URM2_9BURK|nr:TrbI/VirB10 family protein [Massilia sp. YMA4]AXA91338.1 conjugal transfer protein TraB [Massilia sp. YMA4]